ncbi:hypothetical protein SBOR_6122 [Sclerotinia borealis F-4128]|uniref:EKC/KEOPS complex subunit BUD32 n=1 Tax=Sclerotinia borealis (strain F-4128) TaxID=1432307 RepID=W9CCC6_SCLBF|nr:hypothetical protein SBOR_6122 [Sclerotinia borealis F-4128]
MSLPTGKFAMDDANVRPKRVESLNYGEGGFHPIHLDDLFKHDRYKIIHKLGHGGFATVWLARDTNRERYVAMKVLASRLSRGSPEVEILRMMKMSPEHIGKSHVMSLLDHFFHTGPNGRHLCLVSEVGGPSIKQFNECPGEYKGSRRLEASVARNVCLQAINGLNYIHTTGIVHGDVTPANILLQLANIDEWTVDQIYERLGVPQKQEIVHDSSSLSVSESSFPDYTVVAINMKEVDPNWLSDEIIIIDFGIAFLQKSPSHDIGTPKSYCAPEFLFGFCRSIASDIWALGCTIFEIRTGSRLFKYNGVPTGDEVLIAIVKLLGTLPDEWWDVWQEGLEWYETQTEIARGSTGNMLQQIMETGAHDGDVPPQRNKRKDEALVDVENFKKHSVHSMLDKTDQLVAMAENLRSSEAGEVLRLVNDPGQVMTGSGSNEGIKSPGSGSSNPKSSEAKSSGAKSSEAKTSEAKSSEAKSSEAKSSEAKSSEVKSSDAKSSEAKSSEAKSSEAKSSEAKSSEKTPSSEGISTGLSKWKLPAILPDMPEESQTNAPEQVNVYESVTGNPNQEIVPSIKVELTFGPAHVQSFLEPSGFRISTAEAQSLENLLRKTLKYLPGERITASELSKHIWLSDVPTETDLTVASVIIPAN